MAAAGAKDPLDVLQQMFNETLVQTGKALRASQKNGARNMLGAAGPSHSKMAETMNTYHHALDDVESEIIRARDVLMRDLEKYRAARMPVPSPPPPPPPPPPAAAAAPAPVPTPVPAPAAPAAQPMAPVAAQPKQPPAVMMDMPSTAAHSVSANPKAEVKDEAKRVAPFPDMGMGMGGDVVDLTASDKSAAVPVRPAPAAAAAAAAAAGPRPGPVARATAPVNPSPKPVPPARAAASVTPQPPPPATIGPTAPKAPNPPPAAPAAQTAQDNSMAAMLSLPTTEMAGGAAMADMTGGELNFTNMEFSLAPATEPPSQNAPPAPMAEFDLSSFSATPQDGGNDLLSLDNFGAGTGAAAAATNGPQPGGAVGGAAAGATTAGNAASAQPAPANPDPPAADDNVDSLFDMSGGDSMDLDLNLDAGGMGESSFDDLFIANDTDMGEFDETYFNLD